MDFLKKRFKNETTLSIIWETVLISVTFISLVYFISTDIEVKLDSFQDIALLFLALITLFNGTLSGVTALSVLTFGLYFFSFTFDMRVFLEYLVFVLLFGEFHFHFKRKGKEDKEEKNYLKEKFRELSNAFFALKVSHDQLEKGYLLKPVTLRTLIIDLSLDDTSKNAYIKLFETFEEAFSLKSALFCELNDDFETKSVIPLGESTFRYDESHPMIDKALNSKKAVFLSQSEITMMEKEPALAVLPILDSKENIKALFIIEKMDFLEFNMDNILKIQILLEYLTQELSYNEIKASLPKHKAFSRLDARFVFEINRLSSMYERYSVVSAFVLVHTANPAISLVIEDFRQKKMRLLDMVDTMKINKNVFFLFLLPLERVSGAVSFKRRIDKELTGFSDDEYKILITQINEIQKIQHWISEYDQ